MKATRFLMAAVCAATLSPVFAGGEGWSHDFEAAKKQAAEEKKSLLVDFTGSDWCGWCIKLVDEVFKHDAFTAGVKDKFVLVEIDFPKDKSKLSEETQKQNEGLQETYAVQGFPTIMLMDEKGRPFAKTGYQPGGPEKYVTHLDELLAARTKRDEMFSAAETLEGPAKAKALIAALEAMELEDATVSGCYGGVIEQIKASDPDDESGFNKKAESAKKFAEFESKLNEFGSKQDHEGALKLVTETLESGEFEGENLQQVTLIKGMILAQSGKTDEALAALDAAKAIAPDSELGQRVDMFKERINQMKAAEAAKAENSKEEAEEAPAETKEGE